MNLSFYTARKILSSTKGSFSRTASILGTVSVAMAVVVLILAFGILGGFKQVIKEKIYNYDSHLTIERIEELKFQHILKTNDPVIDSIRSLKEVSNVSFYVDDLGLLQHDDQLEGIFIHGVSPEFDHKKFADQIKEGRYLDAENKHEILLSTYIANRLNIKLNDKLLFYKLGDTERQEPRVRKLQVVGIFETNIEEVDKRKAIANMSLTQPLQRMAVDQIEGIQVNLHSTANIEFVEDRINSFADLDLIVYPVYDKYFALFDWLGIISNNVTFLIIIIAIITTINTCSIVLVIIMERSSMIGVMRALGGSIRFVQMVFFDVVLIIGARGLLLGNALAIGLALIQHHMHVIPLDPQNYYMSYVPVELNVLTIILINLGTAIGFCVVTYLPILVISGIRPVKSIRFD